MRKLILFVDDEPPILRSLMRVFRKTDYEVMTAESGAQALEIIRDNPVAVLMSDYTMPDIAGAELLFEAGKIRPEMSRIILSGNSDQESAIKSINRGGALKFLTKPWNAETLLSEVDEAYRIWYENNGPLKVSGLLNQVEAYAKLESLLENSLDAKYAVINFQIKEIATIRQILCFSEERDFLREYLSVERTRLSEHIVLGLLDDGSYLALMPIPSQENEEIEAINALISSFPEQFEYQGKSMQIRFQSGYAISDEHSKPEDLLHRSFVALTQGAQTGKEGCVAFEASMHDCTVRRLSMSEHLFTALSKKEFLLYYQPKIRVSNQSLYGAEALIRWDSEALGMISPFDFIPLAEENGLINEIGQWVMQEAARQWHLWFDGQSSGATISVNVSPQQLHSKHFVDQVAKLVDSFSIAPSMFELEITESVFMQDIDSAVDKMNEIKSLGVKLSIDDFGTGYSSLNYLHKLPLDVIKIDRSFIVPLVDRQECQSLVKNLISMGKDLNMEIVAEGVEDAQQLDILTSYGCDVIQGFYFSPPVPNQEFETIIKNYPVAPSTENQQPLTKLSMAR